MLGSSMVEGLIVKLGKLSQGGLKNMVSGSLFILKNSLFP